jgi:DNA repair protein RecN (Recombination protein N)
VLDANGRSRAYLNGSPVTQAQLREVAEGLVDIHGQHAHQSLLRGDAQRALLDSHARLDGLLTEVAATWRQWREAKSRLDAAADGIEALAAEREQLSWQLGELTALGFSSEEWRALNDEHKRLAHAASLVEGAEFSLQVLAEGDSACEAQVTSVANRLDGLSEYDPALSEVAVLLQSAQAELSEAISALRRYANRVELDPQRLTDVESRIEAVLDCARKFRCTPDELPALLARWQETIGRTRRRRRPRRPSRTRRSREASSMAKLARRLSAARATAAAALAAKSAR